MHMRNDMMTTAIGKGPSEVGPFEASIVETNNSLDGAFAIVDTLKVRLSKALYPEAPVPVGKSTDQSCRIACDAVLAVDALKARIDVLVAQLSDINARVGV